MSFFDFHQNNTGGSWIVDEKRGISTNVIIEANYIADAVDIAHNIGIYFDGVSAGMDCSCCGDRWNEPFDKGTADPQVYDEIVYSGKNFPSQDESRSFSHKWTEEGVPDGFIHYLDGRIEPFHQYTNERKDLDGQYGYGVHFNPGHVEIFKCGKNGWDESGNLSAPWAEHQGSGKMPNKPQVIVKAGYGVGWFPTEEEALNFETEYEAATNVVWELVKKEVKKPRPALIKKALTCWTTKK